MITYTKSWFGTHLAFRLVGTSWPAGIVPGLFSAALGMILSLIEDVDETVSDKEQWLDHPYPFQVFASMVAFAVVFRTNFAFRRYWEAFDAVQRMGAKWFDGACMAVAFDAPGSSSTSYLNSAYDAPQLRGDPANGCLHTEFLSEMVHLFSLLHALALMHLRRDNELDNLQEVASSDERAGTSVLASTAPLLEVRRSTWVRKFSEEHVKTQFRLKRLPVLGRLRPEELSTLKEEVGCDSPSLVRVTMLESWVFRRLVARQKYEPAGDSGKTSPPILSRLYQVISDGHMGFSQAAKVAETPFPFPYHNLLRIFLWMFSTFVPFVVNAKLFDHGARFIMNFTVVWAHFALCEVGDNLEDPFTPYDANDLPLELVQYNFNARLLSLSTVPLPRQEEAEEKDVPTSEAEEKEDHGGMICRARGAAPTDGEACL